MAELRVVFVNGAKAQGIDGKIAEDVYDLIREFAMYSFSAAYALLTYQTAWLKTHYKAEFIAALQRAGHNASLDGI